MSTPLEETAPPAVGDRVEHKITGYRGEVEREIGSRVLQVSWDRGFTTFTQRSSLKYAPMEG